MRRQKRRSKEVLSMPEISLTPLIDTALTLLVIFMVTAPMLQHNIKVDLPQGVVQDVPQTQSVVLSCTKEGEVYLNNKVIHKDSLVEEVKASLGGSDSTPVQVRADKALSYGKVVELVEEMKRAGLKCVTLSLQP